MSNLLKDKYPELLKEWDFEKNKDLNLSKLLSGSNKKLFGIATKNTLLSKLFQKELSEEIVVLIVLEGKLDMEMILNQTFQI